MSTISPGQGWWLASDGQWYPPSAPLGGLPPPIPVDPPNTPGTNPFQGHADRHLAPAMSGPGADDFLLHHSTAHQLHGLHLPQVSHRLRLEVSDPRGLLVATSGVLLLVASFLPYYTLSGGNAGPAKHILEAMSREFGRWHIALPLVAGAVVLVGILNAVLNVRNRAAVPAFIVVRILLFVQLGLWIFAYHDRHLTGSAASGTPITPTVTWLGVACLAVAAVAVLLSFASLGNMKTD